MSLSFRARAFPVLPALALALVVPACGQSSGAVLTLPTFGDLTSATPAIQKAAHAVVRIETSNEAATGSFISATGLLLTNNHVLGTEICAVEGCYAELTFDYQRGVKPSSAGSVFVKPVAVSVGLDMAVVQVYESQGGTQLATPSYLTIESHDAASLMKTNITLVGHPEGHLKKWTAGEVVDSNGDWIYTTAFLLPGNSGSPMLNDAGNIVGIIHRGPTGEDYFTSDGALTLSIGSPSALLEAAMKAPLPPEMISVTAPATAASVVANNLVYRNAQVTSVTLTNEDDADGGGGDGAASQGSGGGTTTATVLSTLATACDAALAAQSFPTPEDLDAALEPCNDAMLWIECRQDVIAEGSPGSLCPSSDEITLWQKRFAAMNAATIALNDQPSLSAMSFGLAALTQSRALGQAAGASGLQTALGASGQPLDLGVAAYLAAFAVTSYQGNQTTAYVSGYANVPDYALSASNAASAAVWLYDNSLFTSAQALAVIDALYKDASIDLGSKLYIEDLEYQSGEIE